MAEMRRCIGSEKFGIEAHEAPVGDFPVQPSQKDGLGRFCKPHWTDYTRALRKAALARKGAISGATRPRTRAEKAAAKNGKSAIRPVPKPAKKPARGRRQAATKREAAAVVEAADGGTIDDAAFGRERETELDRAAQGPSDEGSIA